MVSSLWRCPSLIRPELLTLDESHRAQNPKSPTGPWCPIASFSGPNTSWPDVNQRIHHASDDASARIHSAFLEFGFLVFPGQFLSVSDSITFGQRFSQPEFGGSYGFGFSAVAVMIQSMTSLPSRVPHTPTWPRRVALTTGSTRRHSVATTR